jgi:hypothetical protein
VRFLRANDENLRYDAGLALRTSAGRGSAGVAVEPGTYAPESEADLRRNFGCDHLPSRGSTCVYRGYPDGTVVTLVVSNGYHDGRPDPNASRKLGGKDVPLTLEQIITIGRDPGLTLYP